MRNNTQSGSNLKKAQHNISSQQKQRIHIKNRKQRAWQQADQSSNQKAEEHGTAHQTESGEATKADKERSKSEQSKTEQIAEQQGRAGSGVESRTKSTTQSSHI